MDCPPSTQRIVTRKSQTKYDFVILFVWNENKPAPFFFRPLSSIDKEYFPFEIITGELSQKLRCSTFPLEGNIRPKTDFSCFCKIQVGMAIF